MVLFVDAAIAHAGETVLNSSLLEMKSAKGNPRVMRMVEARASLLQDAIHDGPPTFSWSVTDKDGDFGSRRHITEAVNAFFSQRGKVLRDCWIS